MFRDEPPEGPTTDSFRSPIVAEAWERTLRRLRAELGEDVYSSWFNRVELDAVSGRVARLTVPTRFLKSWIQQHYADRVLGHFRAEYPGIDGVTVSVRSALPRATMARLQAEHGQAPVAAPAEKAPRAPQTDRAETRTATIEASGQLGSTLERRHTFASFLVGRSNAMARAAAEKVATAMSPIPHYNPLYLHAGVGLGKTHLLQAIAHEAAGAGRKVTYLSAEGFMYGFVQSLKAHTALAFKERLRAIDILVIDDVQFLQGKQIQQEFCHTLNALFDSGRAVVVAADRAPGELETLDERVRSRLKGGLVVEMEALDDDLRRRILADRIEAARAAHPGFEVPAAVVEHVARRITTNGRDLDGAVNRLLAHATLTGTPLTEETAEAAIRDLVDSREPKKVKIEDIQKLVATHFNVSRSDLLSARRTANVVKPRQVAMYLSKMLTPRSLPEIGRRFGGRDHTTVLHAVRKIEASVSKDPGLKDAVELLKRLLLD